MNLSKESIWEVWFKISERLTFYNYIENNPAKRKLFRCRLLRSRFYQKPKMRKGAIYDLDTQPIFTISFITVLISIRRKVELTICFLWLEEIFFLSVTIKKINLKFIIIHIFYLINWTKIFYLITVVQCFFW